MEDPLDQVCRSVKQRRHWPTGKAAGGRCDAGGYLEVNEHEATPFVWLARENVLRVCADDMGLVGSWRFEAGARLLAACTCWISETAPALVLCVGGVDGSNAVCFFDVLQSRVLSAYALPHHAVCVETLVDAQTTDDERVFLHPSFAARHHAVVVGTEQGHAYLFDANLGDRRMVSDLSEPIVLPLTDLMNTAAMDGACADLIAPLHFQDCLAWGGQRARQSIPTENVLVTTLRYSARCGLLFVGFNFSGFLVYSVDDAEPRHFVSSESVNVDAVLRFCLQEPENDPRPTLFLWVAYSADGGGSALAFELHQVAFARKAAVGLQGARYSKPESCFMRLSWSPPAAASLCCLRAVAIPSRLIADHCKDSSVAAMPGDVADTSIMLLSWHGGDGALTGAIFDINAYYLDQLPRQPRVKPRTGLCAFMSQFRVELSSSAAERAFDVAVLADSLERFSAHPTHETFYYPTAISASLSAVESTGATHSLRLLSVQSQLLRFLEETKPVEILQTCPEIVDKLKVGGFTEFFDNDLLEQPNALTALLSVMCRFRMTAALCSYLATARHLKDGTLEAMGEWLWQRVGRAKAQCDEAALRLASGSGDASSAAAVADARAQLRVCVVAHGHFAADAAGAPDELRCRQRAAQLLLEYATALDWFAAHDLLPWSASVDRRVTQLAALLRRHSSNAELHVNRLARACAPDSADTGASVWALPTDPILFLGLFLTEGVAVQTKHVVVCYFLLSIADVSAETKELALLYFERFVSASSAGTFDELQTWQREDSAVLQGFVGGRRKQAEAFGCQRSSAQNGASAKATSNESFESQIGRLKTLTTCRSSSERMASGGGASPWTVAARHSLDRLNQLLPFVSQMQTAGDLGTIISLAPSAPVELDAVSVVPRPVTQQRQTAALPNLRLAELKGVSMINSPLRHPSLPRKRKGVSAVLEETSGGASAAKRHSSKAAAEVAFTASPIVNRLLESTRYEGIHSLLQTPPVILQRTSICSSVKPPLSILKSRQRVNDDDEEVVASEKHLRFQLEDVDDDASTTSVTFPREESPRVESSVSSSFTVESAHAAAFETASNAGAAIDESFGAEVSVGGGGEHLSVQPLVASYCSSFERAQSALASILSDDSIASESGAVEEFYDARGADAPRPVASVESLIHDYVHTSSDAFGVDDDVQPATLAAPPSLNEAANTALQGEILTDDDDDVEGVPVQQSGDVSDWVDQVPSSSYAFETGKSSSTVMEEAEVRVESAVQPEEEVTESASTAIEFGRPVRGRERTPSLSVDEPEEDSIGTRVRRRHDSDGRSPSRSLASPTFATATPLRSPARSTTRKRRDSTASAPTVSPVRSPSPCASKQRKTADASPATPTRSSARKRASSVSDTGALRHAESTEMAPNYAVDAASSDEPPAAPPLRQLRSGRRSSMAQIDADTVVAVMTARQATKRAARKSVAAARRQTISSDAPPPTARQPRRARSSFGRSSMLPISEVEEVTDERSPAAATTSQTAPRRRTPTRSSAAAEDSEQKSSQAPRRRLTAGRRSSVMPSFELIEEYAKLKKAKK